MSTRSRSQQAEPAEPAAHPVGTLISVNVGKPKDVPVAFQPAKGRVRAQDEAARLPRAQVYGVKR